jgi:hypothetical protein
MSQKNDRAAVLCYISPDDVPVLVGQVPLELLDFVVDLGQRALVGNPAHGGQQVIELY